MYPKIYNIAKVIIIKIYKFAIVGETIAEKEKLSGSNEKSV